MSLKQLFLVILKNYNLLKVPIPSGQYVYSLPNDRKFHPLEKLGRYLMDSFVNIDGTDNLLVLKHYLVMHNLLSYIRPNQLGRSTRHNLW